LCSRSLHVAYRRPLYHGAQRSRLCVQLAQTESCDPYALRYLSLAHRNAGSVPAGVEIPWRDGGGNHHEAGRDDRLITMPDITNPAVDQYMLALLPARDAVFKEMEAQALKRDVPIVGPAVGRVLYQYARLINAKKVFELGSAIGYSTLGWAHAVGEGGEVFYTDGDPKKADEARGYFQQAGVA